MESDAADVEAPDMLVAILHCKQQDKALTPIS